MIKRENKDFSEYVENRIDIGLFFFFVACAGVSIIVWAFNWICWLNQCCCCDFLHNPVNKRIAWWISFSFLLGMLAFCICAFVSVNRFGFALQGAWCSLDRIYYDFTNGQLKETGPKWTGLTNLYDNILTKFEPFEESIKNYKSDNLDQSFSSLFTGIYLEKYQKLSNSFKELRGRIIQRPTDDDPQIKYLTPIKDALSVLIQEFNTAKDQFYTYKEFLENNFFSYGQTIIDCMKILSMIYFCLFLITITFGAVSMMFYACLKRQGYLMTFMHIIWNIIRFFMFSFFIFGSFYGIFSLALKDYVAVIQLLFSSDFSGSKVKIPEHFWKDCSETENYNFAILIDEEIKYLLNEFLTNYIELKNSLTEINIPSTLDSTKNSFYGLCTYKDKDTSTLNCEDLINLACQEGGLFGSFNCGFLRNDLNIVYLTLYEASIESKKLSAFSLSASFFGAIAVYFYLLVMHHYNNELFFDSGKSIFRGFDGFGGGYQKANRNQDPAYKKRKLRAEIELTSKNDNNDDEEQ